MRTAPQPGGGYGPEIGQQGRCTGLVFFISGQQHRRRIAVSDRSGFGQRQRPVHLLAAGFVPRSGQHGADVPIEQRTVQGRILCAHALRGAVAGAVLRGDRSHGKADAAAPDGGQDARQRIRRQQKEHPLRRLFHDLQQRIGRFLVHPLHMVEQDGTALCRKAGVEDLRPHGRDLTDQIPPAGPHAGDRNGLPHDAGLDLAAVALARLGHRAAAFAPQKRFCGRTALGVEVIRRHTAGRKTGSQARFAHQQDAVGQTPALQHPADAGLQFFISRNAF